MKRVTLIYLAMMAIIVQFSSCGNDDEKPQTVPTVKTLTAVSTGTTTGTVTGEITDDGNTSITEAGFVYSSNVPLPTTADNKKEVTDFDAFTAELDGLSSGTVYNVRAYAINKKGTSYGDKLTFETGNLAPVASNVQITGTFEVAKTLTATYTYTDAEGNAENTTATGTTFQWYAADNSAGLNETAISGATAKTLVVADAQNGKVLRFKVTPKATTGTLEGEAAFSAYTTVIGSETVTFLYDNVSVTYGTILSTVTGKKWLDRNLGATRLAQDLNDYLAFGDMYQWGRLLDGHQLVTRTGSNPADMIDPNGRTSLTAPYETSNQDAPLTNKFIINRDIPQDWRIPQNDNLWQGVNGVNNPCPTGWRIPTSAEWLAEGITSNTEAFSKLKLTQGGQRSVRGIFQNSTVQGQYWTSTTFHFDVGQDFSFFFYFGESITPAAEFQSRGLAFSCRCIKD